MDRHAEPGRAALRRFASLCTEGAKCVPVAEGGDRPCTGGAAGDDLQTVVNLFSVKTQPPDTPQQALMDRLEIEASQASGTERMEVFAQKNWFARQAKPPQAAARGSARLSTEKGHRIPAAPAGDSASAGAARNGYPEKLAWPA